MTQDPREARCGEPMLLPGFPSNAVLSDSGCPIGQIIVKLLELRARGVTLLLELSPDLPNVNVDRVQLQQVVVNLAVSSIRAIAR